MALGSEPRAFSLIVYMTQGAATSIFGKLMVRLLPSKLLFNTVVDQCRSPLVNVRYDFAWSPIPGAPYINYSGVILDRIICTNLSKSTNYQSLRPSEAINSRHSRGAMPQFLAETFSPAIIRFTASKPARDRWTPPRR